MDLQDIYNPVSKELKEVKRLIVSELENTEFEQTKGVSEYIKGYQGKMLRPTFLLLCGRLFSRELLDKHILISAGIELIHLATLIHDDVLDEAELRRGKVTLSKLRGNEASVLFGDYLLSKAFHFVNLADDTKVALIISTMTKYVCEGELMQCLSRENFKLAEEEYIRIIENKTASFFESVGEVGARLSHANGMQIVQVKEFGRNFGLAYQIIDDIVDIVGTEEQAGKTLFTDVHQLKPTLPMIYAGKNDYDKLAELITSERKDTKRIKAFIQEVGGLQYAWEQADKYLDQAEGHLQSLPENECKDALRKLVSFYRRKLV